MISWTFYRWTGLVTCCRRSMELKTRTTKRLRWIWSVQPGPSIAESKCHIYISGKLSSMHHSSKLFKISAPKALTGVLGPVYPNLRFGPPQPSDDENSDNSNECVVCLSDLRDTLILPCRHLCLCNSCADTLRYQANNCPICRLRTYCLDCFIILRTTDLMVLVNWVWWSWFSTLAALITSVNCVADLFVCLCVCSISSPAAN